MSEIVKQILDAEQHKRPHPFPRIDMGPEFQPRYAIWQGELNELTAEIQRLTTALENARKDAWQTIETADKEASKVILWNGAFVTTGFFYEGIGWMDDDAGEYNFEPMPVPPTHWTPLPQLPLTPTEKAT